MRVIHAGRWIFAAVMCLLATHSAWGGAPVVSTMRNVPAVASAQGFYLAPVTNAGGNKYPGDEAPSQVFEVLRPNNEAFTIGRLYTSCTCVTITAPTRTFRAGDRALLEMRNVRPTPQAGQVYALYVQITSPINAIIRIDTFVQSDRFRDPALANLPIPAVPATMAPEDLAFALDGEDPNAPDSPLPPERYTTPAPTMTARPAAPAITATPAAPRMSSTPTPTSISLMPSTPVTAAPSLSATTTTASATPMASGVELKPVTVEELRAAAAAAAAALQSPPPMSIIQTPGVPARTAMPITQPAPITGPSPSDSTLLSRASEPYGSFTSGPVIMPSSQASGTTTSIITPTPTTTTTTIITTSDAARAAEAQAADKAGKEAIEAARRAAERVIKSTNELGWPANQGQQQDKAPPVRPTIRKPAEATGERIPGSEVTATMPMQHISLVTIGVRNLPRSIAFYKELGWNPVPRDSYEYIAFFQLNGQVLCLYPIEDLLREQGMESVKPVPGGITLAIHLQNKEDVTTVYNKFLKAGGKSLKEPMSMPSGAMTAYVTDIDGNPWEISCVPQFKIGPKGELWLP